MESVDDIKRLFGTCPGRGAARHDRTARPTEGRDAVMNHPRRLRAGETVRPSHCPLSLARANT